MTTFVIPAFARNLRSHDATCVIARSGATKQSRHRGGNGGGEMARLTGKVALITGAAGGQGTAEAELFVREEAAVVLTDIDAAAGEGLVRRLEGEGSKVL